MDFSLPQAYLTGLLVLLAGAAVVVARQILRVRRDEAALARLEAQGRDAESSVAELYELGSVQLRKRLYGQATETLKRAAKRFKATGSGKFMRRHAFRNHLLDHKSPKRKRHLGTMAVVDERDADNVSAMLPYS